MISSLSDELIMAFVDGELDAPAARRVREAMRQHEAMRRKHDIYESTRVVMARSFAPIATEPVPDRLTRTIALARTCGHAPRRARGT